MDLRPNAHGLARISPLANDFPLAGQRLEKQPNRVIVDVSGVGLPFTLDLHEMAEPGEIALRVHVREPLVLWLATVLELHIARAPAQRQRHRRSSLAVLSGIEPNELVSAFRTEVLTDWHPGSANAGGWPRAEQDGGLPPARRCYVSAAHQETAQPTCVSGPPVWVYRPWRRVARPSSGTGNFQASASLRFRGWQK